MITFTIWGPYGEAGSITVPTPKRWWRRWGLKAAAALWNAMAEVERQRPPRYRPPFIPADQLPEAVARVLDYPPVEPATECSLCGAILHGYPCIHHADECPVLVA